MIGPYNPYGGIGAVINSYKSNIDNLNIVYTYTNTHFYKNLLFFIKSFFIIIYKFNSNKNIKIIHIHSASKGSFIRKSLIAIFCKVFKKKIVFHLHSGSFKNFYHYSHLNKIYIKYMLSKMDKIICLSEDWVCFYNNIINKKSVEILGNPINVNKLNLKSINFNSVQLLYLGNISDEKGIFHLINYLKTNKYFIDCRIKLKIGGIGDHLKLMSIIEDFNLANNIIYLGWVEKDEKDALLNNTDIYILPSFFEGLPVSILEAMSYGKPIISTNIGGIPSLVKNNYNGWLFNPSNFNELDKIFDDLFTSKKIIQTYQKNSHRIALKYSTSTILKKLDSIYSKLL